MKLKITEDSIYHANNFGKYLRQHRKETQAAMLLSLDETELNFWLCMVQICPRLFGEKVSMKLEVLASQRNCHAFALGLDKWFEPINDLWPDDVPRSYLVECFAQAYERHGFKHSRDFGWEPSKHKIVLYEKNGYCTHTCLQTSPQLYTSKMGGMVTIENHSLSALEGRAFGQVAFAMEKKL